MPEATPKLIAEVPGWKDGEVIRVVKDEFRGTTYIGVRVWYKDSLGNFQPGKQGMNIPEEDFFRLQDLMGIATKNMVEETAPPTKRRIKKQA